MGVEESERNQKPLCIYEIIKEKIKKIWQIAKWKINSNSIFIPQHIPSLSWALPVTADFFSYKNLGNSSQPQSIIKLQWS